MNFDRGYVCSLARRGQPPCTVAACQVCPESLGWGHFTRPVPEVRYDLTGATFSALLRTGQPTLQREDLYAGLSESAAEWLRASYFELTSDETARRLGWSGFAEDE